jgi:hypothetical protein
LHKTSMLSKNKSKHLIPTKMDPHAAHPNRYPKTSSDLKLRTFYQLELKKAWRELISNLDS